MSRPHHTPIGWRGDSAGLASPGLGSRLSHLTTPSLTRLAPNVNHKRHKVVLARRNGAEKGDGRGLLVGDLVGDGFCSLSEIRRRYLTNDEGSGEETEHVG